LGAHRDDGHLRHPRDPRGVLPLDARRGHVRAAGAHHEDRAHRPAAPPRRGDARDGALLRADHRGAREPARLGGGGGRTAPRRRRGAVGLSVVAALAPSSGVAVARTLRGWLLPLGIFVGFLVVWDILVRFLGLAQFILPAPSRIAEAWGGFLPRLLV